MKMTQSINVLFLLYSIIVSPVYLQVVLKHVIYMVLQILKVINERGPSPCILDPSVPLCPEENVNAMEQLESDEEMENLQLQAESNKEKLVNRVSR